METRHIINATGWLGYSELHFRELCHKYLDQGFTAFKLKVGSNMDDDINRCRIIREIIGWKNQLVTLFI